MVLRILPPFSRKLDFPISRGSKGAKNPTPVASVSLALESDFQPWDDPKDSVTHSAVLPADLGVA